MINLTTIEKRLNDLEKSNLELKNENKTLKKRVEDLESSTLKHEDKQSIIDMAATRASLII